MNKLESDLQVALQLIQALVPRIVAAEITARSLALTCPDREKAKALADQMLGLSQVQPGYLGNPAQSQELKEAMARIWAPLAEADQQEG